MRSYFTQFGEVTRLRLSRNKNVSHSLVPAAFRLTLRIQTGASKHYAFIEFEHDSVAQIVAETMDNYLLHGHILICKVVPQDQIHPKMWIGANKKFRPIPKGRAERLKHNGVSFWFDIRRISLFYIQPKTEDQKKAISARLIKREEKTRAKLEKLGIEYDFDGYTQSLPSKKLQDEKHQQQAQKLAKKLEDQVKKDAILVEKSKEPKQPRPKRAKKA